MNYKILINGRGALTKDLLQHASDNVIYLSTSNIWEDIVSHLNYFQPDAYICAYRSDDMFIAQLESLKDNQGYQNIPFVVVGDADECESFEKEAPYLATMMITKPTSAYMIEHKIIAYIDEQIRQRAAAQAEYEAMLGAKDKAKAEADIRAKQEIEEAKKKMELESTATPAASKPAPEISRNEPAPREVTAKPLQTPTMDMFIKQSASAPAAAAPVPQAPPKKHVLVVDDDRNILKMLKAALSADYDVTTMLNGKMAEKYLLTKSADLILLDYEMPVESGPEVFRKLKQDKTKKDIPVIFLTGISDSEKIKEVFSLHPRGYLLKPISVEKLLGTIKDIIG